MKSQWSIKGIARLSFHAEARNMLTGSNRVSLITCSAVGTSAFAGLRPGESSLPGMLSHIQLAAHAQPRARERHSLLNRVRGSIGTQFASSLNLTHH